MVGQGGLKSLLTNIKDQDPDKVSMGLASSLDTVGQLELLQVIMIIVTSKVFYKRCMINEEMHNETIVLSLYSSSMLKGHCYIIRKWQTFFVQE